MLPHLIRKEFADRTWDAADLDAAAELWLRLYESAAKAQSFAATPSHTVEIRLRGFPHHQTDALTSDLCRRVAASDFPAPEVYPHDPDTLVVYSGVIPGTESPPAGLGLPLLAGPPFDGLLAEVRVEAVGTEGRIVRRGKVRTAFVMVGELRGGQLLLKAIWRSGTSGWEDDVCWHAPWPNQDAFFAALERFRESEDVPSGLAKKLFTTAGIDRTAGRIVWLVRVPLGKPRLAGLVLRCLIFAGLLVGLGFGLYTVIDGERWIWLPPFAVAAGLVVWLGSVFARTEARLFFQGYHQFRTRYTALYDEAVKVVPLSRAEADVQLDHPWGRKLTADLEAAGFRYFGDVQPQPQVGGRGVIRVFLAPDGVTYLNVIFSTATHRDPEAGFRLWPAAVVFLTHTYFPDGGRVAGMHGRHLGYRKKRTGPEQLARLYPDADDPAELVRLHREAAAEFAKEWGRGPLGHERFDQYVRRQNDLQEEERRLYSEQPYTWGDHLRWYLQTPRAEYRA